MIVYNVTCNVTKDVAEEWLSWMQEVHIPDVMETGLFTKYRLVKVMHNQPGDEGFNYSIQYHTENEHKLNEYQTVHGPGLKQKTLEKYGEKVLAFRTLLEVIVD